MYKNRRKRSIVIVSLLVIICLMAAGYAAFQTQLEVTSTSNIASNWLIKITDVQVVDKSGSAEDVEDSTTYTDLTANIEANLYGSGDSIKYEITISNLGNLDAVLSDILTDTENSNDEAVIITFSGYAQNEILEAGESTTIHVTIAYNPNYTGEETSSEVTIDFEYTQNDSETNPSENNYLVTYDCTTNGGTDCSYLNEYVQTGSSIDLSKTGTSKSNYKFIGWHTDPEATSGLTTLIMESNNITLYAIYAKAPTLTLTIGNNVQGNNDWYRGLNIDIEATDEDGEIIESKYCVTNEESCTPDTDIELTDGKGTYQFESDSEAQTLCVMVKNTNNIETTKCTDAYKVDSEAPTITNITATADEDQIEVRIEASDEHSGVAEYYYSKDSGENYIEVDSNVYYFTDLNNGTYFIVVYVEDEAGNISEMSTATAAVSTDFCTINGIDNLSDCIIAKAADEVDVDEAKSIIEAKGDPDFTTTSPSIIYSESHATNTSTITRTTYFYVSSNYTYNSSTGYYTLSGYTVTDPESIDFSSGNYYACTSHSTDSTSTTCTTLYKLVGVSTTTDTSTATKTYTLTVYPYTSAVTSYNNSELGMYASEDDNGMSYYFRGAEATNYVKLGDYYWRVIRVNGDNSLRLIYDGTEAHSNGEESEDRQLEAIAFNSWTSDNAYVGYMYGDTSNNVISEASNTFTYTGLSASSKYYFGTSYTFDPSTNTFTLSGTLITATLSEYNSSYYYTCFSTSETGTCQRLYHVQRYVSETSMSVKVIEWSSTSYTTAHANEVDSTIKSYLDEWYLSNLSSYSSILSSSAIFCNNRQVSSYSTSTYKNTGYGSTPTYYSYPRFYETNGSSISPSLECPQDNDKFSVTTSNGGNGVLTYPIGLITADEVSMAGGRTDSQNTLYYLYTGSSYWTMTPSLFSTWNSAFGFRVTSTGTLYDNTVGNSDSVMVRPVINLNTDNLEYSGSGTYEDPYVIES